MRQNEVTKKVVYTALLIALTVAMRYALSIMLPFAGVSGMRISPSVFFTKMPAVLFGPLYGAISSGIIDIVCLIVKPEGSFIPYLTLTAILGGFICGFLWKNIENINKRSFKIVFGAVFSIIGVLGVVNTIAASFFKDSAYTLMLLSIGEKRYWFLSIGLICASVFGIILLLTDYFVSKKDSDSLFIKLLCVLLIANIIVTTLNTFVLRIYFPALNSLSFMVFYIPRLVEEVIVTVLQAYIMAYLLKLLNKTKLIKL
ncbi:MAG: ECF transporter S component [Ruminococcaceae bacterium]|nr:ECF transporter S component [Oscillospiraceae bacterium]